MKKLLLVACLMMGVASAKAQDYFKKDTIQTPANVSNIFIIRLKDGTRLKGRIIEQNTEQSKIQTENMGLVTVKANQIVSMELTNNNQPDGEKTYYENRFIDRIHLTPTAFPMTKGDIDYHNYYLYYNEVSVALGSRVSVGIGTAIIPFVSISNVFPYNLKAKATLISTEKIHFSVSGYLIGANNANTTLIIPTLTIGKKESFFNIAPLFYTGNNFSGSFGLSLGYMKKTSPNLTFFSENFFALGSSIERANSIGAGFRFDRKRHSFDVSLNMLIINSKNYYSSYYNNAVNIYPVPSVGYHLKLSK
jgi:hypothetical protein